MKLYIVEYYNNSYFGRPIDVELLTKNYITLFDLNEIYKDFNETPTHIDLSSLNTYGRCLITSLKNEGKFILLVNPLHQLSKSVMRQINLNRII